MAKNKKINFYEVYYYSGRERVSLGLYRAKDVATLRKRLKQELDIYYSPEIQIKKMKYNKR